MSGEVKERKKVSSIESCGFVTHVLCYPIGLLYLLWATVPDDTLHSMDFTYYPPKSLALQIPTFAIILFLLTPIIYALLNAASVPADDSLDILWDGHTHQQQSRRRQVVVNDDDDDTTESSNNHDDDNGTCDDQLDATNEKEENSNTNSTTTTTSSSSNNPQNNDADEIIKIGEIYDLDVSVINRWTFLDE